jgi:putative transposase
LSYRGNAVGEHNALLSPHSLYLGLGASAKDRQATYRDLFASQLDSQTLRDVRSCVQTGTPLGNDRFMECGNRAFALRLIFGQDGQ